MMTSDEFYELYELDIEFQELIRLESYDNFWKFCLFMDYDFFKKREKVLQPVAEAFQDLSYDLIDLLYVGIAPRTGKSYITSLWVTWELGRNPDAAIMRNTVTAKLYKKFSADIRDIMLGKTHNKRYQQVFSLKFETTNLDGWKLTTALTGMSYFGGGVGGSIIGFGATKAAILDDSVKNEEEALSQNALDKKWGWYGSTHKSRMEKGCKEIHIATRWSNQDIPGQLIEKGFFDGKRAKKIIVPALDENGNSYCEEIHTTEKLLIDKKLLDPLIWEAEWMQNPIEAEGLLFPSGSLKTFTMDELYANGKLKIKPDAVYIVGDIADEGNDKLSVPVGLQYGKGNMMKIFVTDVIFTPDPIEITQPRTAAFIDKHMPDRTRFESNNGGKGFAQKVSELLKVVKKHVIQWKHTVSNKHTRIIMKSGVIKEHFYFRSDYEIGSEYYHFMKEMMKYQKNGKAKHDDAPDSITMLAEKIESVENNSWGWNK